MLPLDYSPEVPRRVLDALEKWGRSEGLRLEDVELLGQDPRVASGFVAAARRGEGRRFVESVDFHALARTLDTRQRFPERLEGDMPDLALW